MGVKGGFAAAKRSRPLTPMSAPKKSIQAIRADCDRGDRLTGADVGGALAQRAILN
jgi:hypothetical protein